MAGRPPLPDAVKALKGTLRPCRVNRDAPKLEPVVIGSAPAHLTAEERQAWDEIAAALNPMRVATSADTLAIECAAIAVATMRRARLSAEEFSDVVSTTKAALQALGQLGLTPSMRSKVNAAPAPKKADPLSEFLS